MDKTDIKTFSNRYTRVAITLHWVIAVLIFYNMFAYFYLSPSFPARRFFVSIHISAGITVLLLTVVRVIWRLMHSPPPMPADTPKREKNTAHIVHFLLYAGMVLMPLTGWATLSAHAPVGSPGEAAAIARDTAAAIAKGEKPPPTRPTLYIWWSVELPMISVVEEIGRTAGGIEAQKHLQHELGRWHIIGAYFMIGLLFLHLAGALKHEWFDGQDELERMGIRSRWKRGTAGDIPHSEANIAGETGQ